MDGGERERERERYIGRGSVSSHKRAWHGHREESEMEGDIPWPYKAWDAASQSRIVCSRLLSSWYTTQTLHTTPKRTKSRETLQLVRKVTWPPNKKTNGGTIRWLIRETPRILSLSLLILLRPFIPSDIGRRATAAPYSSNFIDYLITQHPLGTHPEQKTTYKKKETPSNQYQPVRPSYGVCAYSFRNAREKLYILSVSQVSLVSDGGRPFVVPFFSFQIR